MKGLVLLLLVLGVFGAAHAEDVKPFVPSAPAANQPANTACQNKHVEELCKLSDGSGGTCTLVECPKGKCLQCVQASTIERETSSLWIPMIAFGMTVALVGGVFWWRLKKLFNNK